MLAVHSGDEQKALPLPQQLQRSPSGKTTRRTTSPTTPTTARRTRPLASLIASPHDARAALGAVNERSKVAARPAGLRWSRQRRHPRTHSCNARHRARSSFSTQHRPRTVRFAPLALVLCRRRRPCASRAGSPRSVGATRACCSCSAVAPRAPCTVSALIDAQCADTNVAPEALPTCAARSRAQRAQSFGAVGWELRDGGCSASREPGVGNVVGGSAVFAPHKRKIVLRIRERRR